MWNKTQSFFSNRSFLILAVCLFGLIGILIVIYCTRWGAALSDDSFYYISSARNFLAGHGFDLTPHFAPVLPLLLSVIGLFKIDPLTSVRWVNAILFGLNIFFIAWIIRSLTGSSAFSLLGAMLALAASTLIVIHSWALSEALYISFCLLGFLVYATTYPKGYRGNPALIGLCFGLAAGTRYIGVSLLLAGGIFWLTEAGKTGHERLRNTFWFSGIGVIPLLLWTMRNQMLIGRPTSRVFAWHPMSEGLWIKALNTMFLWLAPGRLVHGKELVWLGGIGLVLLIWLGMMMFRDRYRLVHLGQFLHQCKPVFLICLGILLYWVILIISRSFFDDRIPMDERLLSPILAMGLILLVWLFAKSWNHSERFGRSIIVAVILILLIVNLARSAQTIQSYHQSGRGYASARDHISETYAYLRKRPNIPVYSNAFAAIYFWTGRVTNPLPAREGIPDMKAVMRQTGAYLVVFDSIPVENYGVTNKELIEGLITQIRLSEATIYRSP